MRVKEQVPIEDKSNPDASIRYADLVLDIPYEWFLIELKFSAAETGTEFYSRATHLDSVAVDDYESGQYYLLVISRTAYRPAARRLPIKAGRPS